MFRNRTILTGGLLAGALLVGGLTACGSAPAISGAAAPAPAMEFAEEEAAFAGAEAPAEFAAEGSAFADDGSGGRFDQQVAAQQERLIIRTGDLTLTVDDTTAALEAIGQMTNAMGGFVVSSNTYQNYDDAYYGTISVRVPAERFDEAMDAIKAMAVEVKNETVSGQDVTEEYVDLEARVTNLKAAEEQLQQIMDDAQDTEDVLSVYNQLVEVRGEIESLQGRMQYLSESARLSTINVSLEPNIITQPVDVRWKPLETFKLALERLGRTMADVVNFLINFIIVVVPTLLVIGIVLGLAFSPFYFVGRAMLRRRRRRRQEKQQAEES